MVWQSTERRDKRSTRARLSPILMLDDYLGANHLQIINDNFAELDWIFADHKIYNPQLKQFMRSRQHWYSRSLAGLPRFSQTNQGWGCIGLAQLITMILF